MEVAICGRTDDYPGHSATPRLEVSTNLLPRPASVGIPRDIVQAFIELAALSIGELKRFGLAAEAIPQLFKELKALWGRKVERLPKQ